MSKKNNIPREASLSVSPGDTRWLENDESLNDQQTRQILGRLQALYTLGEEVHSCDDYDTISTTVLDFFQNLLRPERAILAIRSTDGLLSVQSRGIDAGNNPADWPVSQNLLRRVCDKHIAVFSTDAQGDAILGQFKSVGSLSIRSVLCVPLGTAQLPRGLIYLDSRIETGIFDGQDLYFLTTVCRLLDAAIESIDFSHKQSDQTEQALKHVELLRNELFEKHRVVGQSKSLLGAFSQLKKIASRTDIPILLRGESGTGKELFARAVHYFTNQQAGAFVPINIASITSDLIESELFGHVTGAFTGATSDRMGLLERADGGTLFLDEVADISPSIQAKLLRVLQEKVLTRVGSNKPIRSDFRLVSATSRNMEKLVEEESFRDDLFHRLAGIVITLPPLRDRTEDIPLLVRYFLQQAKIKITFSATAMEFLLHQPWNGNIRQLQNCVIAAAAMTENDSIGIRDIELVLRPDCRSDSSDNEELRDVAELLKETERIHMLKALDQTNGHATLAAKLIGMSKTTFSEKRKRYGI